jgi:hypothetical protein
MRSLAALALLVAACSPQTAGPPTTTPATSPTACRLAVIEGSPAARGLVQTGFQTLPEGAYTPVTDTGNPYYDRPQKRWVRVGPPSLSADGASYAFVIGDASRSDLHLVDVASGFDKVIASGGPWQVAGLASDSIYAMQVEYVDSAAYGTIARGKGLWKIPLDGSNPSQLTSDSRMWAWSAGDTVFGGGSTLDVAGGPNDIVRFDVRAAQVVTVFSHHMRSRVLAVDVTGAALILAEGDDEELWRVPASGNAVELWSGPPDKIRPEIPVAVDGPDIWLSSAMSWRETAWSIFHYSPATGLMQVATFRDRPVQAAGGCA